MDDSSAFQKMNTSLFWDSVEGDKATIKHAANLIFEKHIYLRDEYDSVLIIGISPHNQMSTAARIEIRANDRIFHFDKVLLTHLLDYIDDRFSESAISPKRDLRHVNIQQLNGRFFKINFGNAHMKIHLNALLSLKRMLPLIKTQITLLERENYESHLFKLLHHIEQSQIDDTCDLECHQERDNYESYLCKILHHPMHVAKFECDCLHKSFVLEIAFNCSDWLTACIPLYINAVKRGQCAHFPKANLAGCWHSSRQFTF